MKLKCWLYTLLFMKGGQFYLASPWSGVSIHISSVLSKKL